MDFKRTVLVLFLCFSVSFSFSQDQKAVKRLFRDAEYYFLIEDYERALDFYDEVLILDPENSNAHYLIGSCYLNAIQDRDKAIPHLEKAIEHTTLKYKEGSYKERNAPVGAFFMLARAYHVNSEFRKAINTYKEYKTKLHFSQFAEIEFVNRHIKACEMAENMINNPLETEMIPMTDITGRYEHTSHPVVSGNDSVIIFAIERPGNNSIALSRLEKNGWTKPRIIDADLGFSGTVYPTCLSYDGNELYLVYQDYMLADLFVSFYDGRRWSRARLLGKNINTRYLETHASLTKDGNTLYFTSDRKEGWGGMDIYKSVRNAEGNWGEAENMGFNINTYYNEETPFITGNDSVLYYSSQGLSSIGGYDIFRCVMDGEGFFGRPVNIGFPLSTPDDDLFFNPGWNEQIAYYAQQPDNDPDRSEIYSVKINSPFPLPIERAVLAFAADNSGGGDRSGDNTQAGRGSGATSSSGQDRFGLSNNERANQAADHSLNAPGDELFIMNNILFGYDESTLNDDAIQEVERIYAMMRKHPEIEIELTGHTDSKGSVAYNRVLSRKRSDAVRNYLIVRGIDSRRITTRAMGEQDPIAINQYEDGSDAPEGRLLNRNVSIRISNLADNRVRIAEIFVPDRLVPVQDRVYTILLLESKTLLDTIPKSISGQPISLIYTDETKMYTYGSFEKRTDALDYLNMVLDAGYPDAYIMEKRGFESTIRQHTAGDKAEALHYTIQIMALKNAVDASRFSNISNIRQVVGRDGFHRYICGEYASINDAVAALPGIQAKGYRDAYVRPLESVYGTQ